MSYRNPLFRRIHESPYFIKEDQGGWRVCKRGRSGKVYDVARQWFSDKKDAERARRRFGGMGRANPRPRHIPEPMPSNSIKWGLMLADDDLSDLYDDLSEEQQALVLKPAAAFLRRWYEDQNYEEYNTRRAMSVLREEMIALRQTDLFDNPLTGLDKWFNEKWVDVCHPPNSHRQAPYKDWRACGRQDDEVRAYPKCRPLAKARKMSRKEMKSACSRKRAVERAETDTEPGRPANRVNPKRRS